MMESMKSALLFRLGGLGDLLVSFPSIHFLRKKFPSFFLTLICRKEYGLLLQETGIVDQVVSVSERRLSSLFADSPRPNQELARWLTKFSLILGWMQKQSSLKLEEHCHSLGIKRCRIFVHDPDCQVPISKFFFDKTLEFLSDDHSPNPSFEKCAFFPLSDEQKKDGLRLLAGEVEKCKGKTVVVHPGSGSEGKCWPFDNFLEIISRLSERGLNGALITGPAEEKLESRKKNISLPVGWLWIQNPSLIKLAGLLQASLLYLGNDSGITHLAALCGTRVVALFRKDQESIWIPSGRVFLLSADSVSSLRPDPVWEKISSILFK